MHLIFKTTGFSLMDRMDDGDGRSNLLTVQLIDHGSVCLGYGGFSITGNTDIQTEFLVLRNFL